MHANMTEQEYRTTTYTDSKISGSLNSFTTFVPVSYSGSIYQRNNQSLMRQHLRLLTRRVTREASIHRILVL